MKRSHFSKLICTKTMDFTCNHVSDTRDVVWKIFGYRICLEYNRIKGILRCFLGINFSLFLFSLFSDFLPLLPIECQISTPSPKAKQKLERKLNFHVRAIPESKAFLIKVSPCFPRLPRIAFLPLASTTRERRFFQIENSFRKV